MRTRSLYGTITAMTIAGALTLSAQTPQTPQTQTTRPSGDQRSGSEQTVTVTGCLQQNSGVSSADRTGTATSGGSTATAGSSAGSAGSAGASGSSQQRASNFVLANAKMAQGSSTSGLGTTTRFSLIGMTDAELSKHVNHHVEVTGRLSAGMGSTGHGGSPTGTTGSTPGGTTPGATGSAGATGSSTGMNELPQLHATSLKMIAATCPAQQ